jgi:HK97 family phage major capsid protein
MSLNHELAQYFKEKGTGEQIAKALKLTHALSGMQGATIDHVIKAMDTQETGAGAEWVEGGWSPEVVQRVAHRRMVASLFNRVYMPNNPYKFPVQGGPATAYITPENTADSGQTSVKFSNAGTAETTFTARKLSAAVRTSDELNQDSIANVAAHVQQSILQSLVDAEENALINGATGTHIDSDTQAGGSDDARRTFNGLRKLTPAAAKVDAGGYDTLTEAVRALRAQMGKYAINANDTVLITGMDGYYRLMNEGTVITQDKYGQAATILTGELGKFDAIPVVVSEYVRNDLDETGVYDTTDQGKTTIIIANRASFAIGDRQTVELEADREAIYGQDILIGRERIDFQPWFATTEKAVGQILNIAKLG